MRAIEAIKNRLRPVARAFNLAEPQPIAGQSWDFLGFHDGQRPERSGGSGLRSALERTLRSRRATGISDPLETLAAGRISAMTMWAAAEWKKAAPSSRVMTIGDGGHFHRLLDHELHGAGVPTLSRGPDAVLGDVADATLIACVLSGYPDTRNTTRVARLLAAHPSLSAPPFMYVAGVDPEKEKFARLDEYPETFFVSPVLLDVPSPYEIYEESLKFFEQKCGLRDFLDLYQCLKHIVTENIPGDVAEFGSFKGHSGWLMAQTLTALGSDKHLYMFDTFGGFPSESLGVDEVWNRTHQVDFDDVRAKFVDVPNVTLVRGEFTETFGPNCPEVLSLAYVDCDSYRATKWLFDLLIDRVSRHGLLICEDYGHPALLGARAATHDSFDPRSGYFRFFSQFSGYFIALKL